MEDETLIMDDETLIMTEFIRQSPNRCKVLKVLEKGVYMPSQIAVETSIHQNNVSRALKQLKEKELVYILNPTVKKGRLYKLTDEGRRILKYL